MGGVDLCYDQNVNDPYSGMNWTAGCHTVDGNTALAFSRMRYADVQGDFGRAARQRQVINAIVKKGASKQTLTNFNKTKKVAAAALSSVTVDEKASTSSLLRMALAFKSASGKDGISGSVYWTDPDYYVDGVGSCVLLDDAKNIQLFSELSHGTHSAGTVGTLAEQQKLTTRRRMWITHILRPQPSYWLAACRRSCPCWPYEQKAPHRISEQHLTVLSWSAPLLAQLIMLIVMCMQRHWLYAAMLAPSLLGSALMLITMINARQA